MMAPCWRRDEPGLFAHTALATAGFSLCSCTFVGLMYRKTICIHSRRGVVERADLAIQTQLGRLAGWTFEQSI